MIYFLRCALIFFIFVETRSCEEKSEYNIIELPVRVYIIPPNNIEFQFEKNSQIEPISLREGNKIFYVSESDTTINFRDPHSINENATYSIMVTVEYRYSGRKDVSSRSFQHEFRHNPEEFIIVRFPSPIATPQLPQIETRTSQSCGKADTSADDLPQPSSLEKQVDVPRKAIEQTYTPAAEAFIDIETLEESCENDYGYTEELLKTALRHSQMGTRLLLKGFKDTKANPVDTIRSIIVNELDLPYLEYNILQAKFIDDGIIFEMRTTKDVVEILRQAQMKFAAKNVGLKIEMTTKSFYDFNVNVRLGDS